MTLDIGSRVWMFDANRRVYERKAGQAHSSAPIYREHFRPLEIVGETRLSWILSNGSKVRKKTLDGVLVSESQIDEACWVNDHLYMISRAVGRCTDASVLRQIAALLGVTE